MYLNSSFQEPSILMLLIMSQNQEFIFSETERIDSSIMRL